MSKVKEAMETYEIVLETISPKDAKEKLDIEGFVVIDEYEPSTIAILGDIPRLTVLGLVSPNTIFDDISFVEFDDDEGKIVIYYW